MTNILNEFISLSDVSRILGITYNSAKNRVLTGSIVPDLVVPNNKGDGKVYRFKREYIESLLSAPKAANIRTAYEERFEKMEARIAELEMKLAKKGNK